MKITGPEEIEAQTIPAAAIAEARVAAARTGARMLDALAEELHLSHPELTLRLGRSFRHRVFPMGVLRTLAPSFEKLPYSEALGRGCLALRDEAGRLLFVFSDPFNANLLAWAEEALQEPFEPCLAEAADLAACLAAHEEALRAIDSAIGPEEPGAAKDRGIEDLTLKSIAEDKSRVVRLVNSTLYDALKGGASDIHLETSASGMAIKYRLDGVLVAVGTAPGVEIAEQVISRIKVQAELDIAEKRIPQDGRFKVSMKGHEVDFRVSIMPSIFGEDAVLRILDKQALAGHVQGLRLDALGFDPVSIQALRRLAREPYGMLLVTGPTGSGKTTTLYAAISEINTGQDKIVTIEDPVEYQLPGVLQIPVNEKKGLTFARGLRSILRHDPDKILVGEIRDPETAQIAVQSALTGHLVFTTVHANNVFDVIGRFLHMGVDPYSFVSALNGILAQRLVRLVCPQCAKPFAPDVALLKASGLSVADTEGFRFLRGEGCGACRGTGYKGRKAISEILILNDEVRELIIAREPIRRIKDTARANGTRFLRDAALEGVRAGETTLEEINRVTFVA